jgi:hypothetical protein
MRDRLAGRELAGREFGEKGAAAGGTSSRFQSSERAVQHCFHVLTKIFWTVWTPGASARARVAGCSKYFALLAGGRPRALLALFYGRAGCVPFARQDPQVTRDESSLRCSRLS